MGGGKSGEKKIAAEYSNYSHAMREFSTLFFTRTNACFQLKLSREFPLINLFCKLDGLDIRRIQRELSTNNFHFNLKDILNSSTIFTIFSSPRILIFNDASEKNHTPTHRSLFSKNVKYL